MMKLLRPLFLMNFAWLLLGASPSFAAEKDVLAGAGTLDLVKVFQAAPIIYSLLLALSGLSFSIWLYSLFTLRLKEMIPQTFINKVRQDLAEKRYEAALETCQSERNFCASIIASGISSRNHGPQVMMEAMNAEGRRNGNSLWQRISLLSEVATIAPMLGLLGTVLGLFFAFYDSNRTAESITTIFDGLGIAVGTTVAGLIVAILAMILYTSLKFRIVNLLNAVENEALSLVNMIEVDSPKRGVSATRARRSVKSLKKED
jgi:biopolymer transport protein ExbB